MKVGDLVRYKAQDDNNACEQTGVITRLRRNSMSPSSLAGVGVPVRHVLCLRSSNVDMPDKNSLI